MTTVTARSGSATRRARMSGPHPLLGSVRRIDRACAGTRHRLDDAADGTWHRCEQILRDPEFFDAWQRVLAEDLSATHGPAPRRTLDGYLLQWYLRIPALPGALLYSRERRVPGLAPRRLAFRLSLSRVSDVALRPGNFWCLPADPAASHPHASVVEDLDELGTKLREQVVAHAARFLRVFGPRTRFGRHTLWSAVSDVLEQSLLRAGDARDEGAADARRVLNGMAPLPPSTAYPVDEGTWTHRRGSCCFHYALPGVERACATCPRVGDAERARLLAEDRRLIP